jgi:glycosyltransferase involved in cell wall biosynthesis
MSSNFKLTVSVLAKNEEKIIPYFIQHYSEIADEILFIDNQSTDNTASIVKDLCSKFNVKLNYQYFESNGFNEQLRIKLFTSIQKNLLSTNSDWYIIVDADEFIFDKSNNLRAKIKAAYDNGYLFIKPNGYQMTEDKFPEYDGIKITEKCKMGCRDEGFDKPIIVHKDLNWMPHLGCHVANGYNGDMQVPPYTDDEILLLHYKFLSSDYAISRIRHYGQNLDQLGKLMLQNGINQQVNASDKNLLDFFNQLYSKRTLVI